MAVECAAVDPNPPDSSGAPGVAPEGVMTDDAQLRALEAAAMAEVALPADGHVVGEPVTIRAIGYRGRGRLPADAVAQPQRQPGCSLQPRRGRGGKDVGRAEGEQGMTPTATLTIGCVGQDQLAVRALREVA